MTVVVSSELTLIKIYVSERIAQLVNERQLILNQLTSEIDVFKIVDKKGVTLAKASDEIEALKIKRVLSASLSEVFIVAV